MASVTVTACNVVLVLNSGSSSLKYAVFDLASPGATSIAAGQVDTANGGDAFAEVATALADAGATVPAAIGHRIVHGGPRLLRHRLIDENVIRELELAEPFAPLHMPAALTLQRQASANYPRAPQVTCFDTAFHANMPEVARTLPIPRRLRDAGLHRYGFHGLSCESIVHQLGTSMPERLIVAHLGNGASVTAVRDGRSIDTSMGLTPSGGVIMGTRSGDIDPGVLVHLMRLEGCGAAELEDMVDKKSGMLGISGLSGDLRNLHRAPEGSDADAPSGCSAARCPSRSRA